MELFAHAVTLVDPLDHYRAPVAVPVEKVLELSAEHEGAVGLSNVELGAVLSHGSQPLRLEVLQVLQPSPYELQLTRQDDLPKIKLKARMINKKH